MNEPGWVGVFGGSFDPVHVGHVRIAEAVRSTFSLSRVMLIPAATPPHKPHARLAPARHRLAMLELALAGRPGLEVSTVELRRGGLSYTIDTLRALRDDATRSLRPLFVLGMDSLLEIDSWKEPRELLAEFALVVVDRPRRARSAGPRRTFVDVAATPGAGAGALRSGAVPGTLFRLALAPIDVSSSRIRAIAGEGGDLTGLVPPAVARYIHKEHLYREEGAR